MCLVGPSLSCDLELVELLLPRNYLILVSHFASLLASTALLEGVDVVALELDEAGRRGAQPLANLRDAAPDIAVIVVDSGVSNELAAEVLTGGAHDFFRVPYEPGLLAARIDGLHEIRRRRRRRDRSECDG